ncbi:cholinesterase 1-like [Oppia nitens]|uniref:cholinesterase 1-like n=1 Tax=Oppia nitens TaxID=1686743 RepID=UPI0023DBDDED|nr:cholinesterase 1-like [Oppia nitens]
MTDYDFRQWIALKAMIGNTATMCPTIGGFAKLNKSTLISKTTSTKTIDVSTTSGTVRGHTIRVLNTDIYEFLNIPYAEPPVGSLRFAKPVPIQTPKTSIIDGTKNGNCCVLSVDENTRKQYEIVNNYKESEDCLTLVVWTSGVDTGAKHDDDQLKPVLFHIHGGGLSTGTAYDPIFNVSIQSTYDIVVVSINYRLGPFGFLYGGEPSAPGNVGFYDQLLALQWVRDNIQQFGGDKNKITLMGISGGSWSISAQILSPLSKGLFQRAIMQSGAELYNKDRPVLSTEEGLEKAKNLAKKVGCDPYDYHWLDCMRQVSDVNLFRDVPENGEFTLMTYPVFGTEFLPQLPQKAFKNNLYNSGIQLIAGITRDEGTLMAIMEYPHIIQGISSVESFRKLLDKVNNRFHNLDVKQLEDYYLDIDVIDRENPIVLRDQFLKLYGDLAMSCPTYRFAKHMVQDIAGADNDVYFYLFNYTTNQGVIGELMTQWFTDIVPHGADIDLTFGDPLRYPNLYKELDYDFTLDLLKIWTNFIKYGKPSNDWPKFDINNLKVRELNPHNSEARVLDNLFERTCDGVWSNYF